MLVAETLSTVHATSRVFICDSVEGKTVLAASPHCAARIDWIERRQRQCSISDSASAKAIAVSAAAAKAKARDASAASASPSGRLIDTKKARKAFMSAEAGKVLNDDVVRAARERDKDAEDGGEARFGKFSALREEVQAFGARGLAKWDRQALETKRLVELGMKPKKGPRIPPTIGVGLAKANEKRAETARQEAFAAGYKLEKKAAKKSSDAARDRGLAWGSSTFSTSNGVMKVNKRDMVNHDKLVDTKAMLRGEGRRPQMKSSGKKTKKKGKAVKAGRKSKR